MTGWITRIIRPKIGSILSITIPMARSVKTEETTLLTAVMIKLSSVFTSVTRLEVIAPLPMVSYSFIEVICKCSIRRSLIINVTYLEIRVNIFVKITVNI